MPLKLAANFTPTAPLSGESANLRYGHMAGFLYINKIQAAKMVCPWRMEIYWEPPRMKEALMSSHVYFYVLRECSESDTPKTMETSASPNHPLFIHLLWVTL